MTTNIHKFIFLFALIQGCFFGKSLLAKSEKEVPSNLKCFPKLLERFISNGSHQDESRPVFATKEHKKICPVLDVTCCDIDNLKVAARNFLDGFYEMEKIRVLIEGTYLWISEITIEEAEAVIKELNPVDENNAEDYKKLIDDFKADWKAMTASKADILKSLAAFALSVRKYYAGFICELCHPRTSDLLTKYNNLSADKERIEIPSAFANYHSSILIFRDFISLANKHRPHYNVFKSLKIKYVAPVFDTLFSEDMSEFPARLQKCIDVKNASDLETYENRNCVDSIWQSNHPTIWSDNVHSIGSLYYNAIQTLTERFQLNPRVVVPESFTDLAIFVSRDLNTSDIVFARVVDGDGFDMTKNLLSEEFWNESALENDML
jgi:hypothetical protein